MTTMTEPRACWGFPAPDEGSRAEAATIIQGGALHREFASRAPGWMPQEGPCRLVGDGVHRAEGRCDCGELVQRGPEVLDDLRRDQFGCRQVVSIL